MLLESKLEPVRLSPTSTAGSQAPRCAQHRPRCQGSDRAHSRHVAFPEVLFQWWGPVSRINQYKMQCAVYRPKQSKMLYIPEKGTGEQGGPYTAGVLAKMHRERAIGRVGSWGTASQAGGRANADALVVYSCCCRMADQCRHRVCRAGEEGRLSGHHGHHEDSGFLSGVPQNGSDSTRLDFH